MFCHLRRVTLRTLSSFIAQKTPKFNKEAVEGLCYHKINRALEYIDNFIKYSVGNKTNTHLQYLGYRMLTPKEEIKFLFNKTGKIMYDIAKNDIYLVEFTFRYGNEPYNRVYYFYVPYMNKGNIIHLSGNRFLVMPILADKVISVGDKIIFINILTAKYSFERSYFGVVVDDTFMRVSIINTVLYKNQADKVEDTTRAKPTVMHYLLANYGYTKTMQMLLGFVPTPVYDYGKNDKVVIRSTGAVPHGYIKNKDFYTPSNIKFAVDKDKYNEEVLYCLGNMFYIIDHFPDSITIDTLDDTFMWKKLLGEIIHSGNHSLAYIMEKINAHFIDLNSGFDAMTLSKLRDINVDSTNLINLLVVIFKNFNNWIMKADAQSLYYNKTYETESFILSSLTSRITRIVLDINKEELRANGSMLDSKIVDRTFKKYFATRAIFGLKKEKQFVTSIEYSGDHLYFKNTSMVVQQESDFTNVADKNQNNAEKKKIVASMATVGSILGLSKKNPIPIVKLNPYVNIDYRTGTILPHPEYNYIIENTDKLLSNIVVTDVVDDIDEPSEDLILDDDSSETDYEDESDFSNDYDEQIDVSDD
jgi:hypothetical protein